MFCELYIVLFVFIVSFRLLVELRAVPANLTFWRVDASEVSLLGLICLLLLHCVNIADDFVSDEVKAVVAVFKKLLLGHFVAVIKLVA